MTAWALVALVIAGGAGWFLVLHRPWCKLAIREGDHCGVEFLIRTREATIGSEEGQTVTVSHPRVSRHHAVLNLEEGRFVLRDRSKQGTRVNGVPITEVVLASGDLIRLGDAIDLIFTRLR